MSGYDYKPIGLCLNEIAPAFGGLPGAERAMYQALVGDQLAAIGIAEWPGRAPSGLSHIPASFWRSASTEDRERWSWSAGVFTVPAGIDNWLSPSGYAPLYRNVELDAEAVAALFPPTETLPVGEADVPDRPRGRRRKLEWNDWVAEVAVAAFNNQLVASMSDEQLMKTINDRLAERGINEMPRSTVQDAVAAILARLAVEKIY